MISYSAIGKRKNAVAKVFLEEGKGNILVNKKEFKDFFSGAGPEITLITDPLTSLNLENTYNVYAIVKGGGISAQLEAIRLGIARSLCEINNDYRKELGKNSYLRRDSRVKESKKYGLRKARKAPQYSKR